MTIVTAFDFLIDVTLKATVLLLFAWATVWLLRRRSAALNHRLWTLTMASLILLPIASVLLPSCNLPVLPAVENGRDMVGPVVASSSASGLQNTPSDAISTDFGQQSILPKNHQRTIEPPVTRAMDSSVAQKVEAFDTRLEGANDEFAAGPLFSSRQLIAVGVWAIGFLVLLFGMLLNVLRTVRFCQRAVPVADSRWNRLLAELSTRIRLTRRVRLKTHPKPTVPLTCGVVRPTVVLPAIADSWDSTLQRSVLVHELAHVKRWDVLCQMIGRIACTLYWFHPLAWLALRMLRQHGEHACDDAVVRTGEKASTYAEQLLRVGQLCCDPVGLSLGVAMAEGSNLEQRVKALFDNTRDHGPVRKVVATSMLLACGFLMMTVSVIRPVSAESPKVVAVAVVSDNIQPQDKEMGPYPSSWKSGTEALQRIIERKPIFGQGSGLRLGIAWATPQRVFQIGERLPVELFLFNAGEHEETTQFQINFLADPPKVVDANGKDLQVSHLFTFMTRENHKLSLRPGEAIVIPALGLRVGGEGPVHLEKPQPGEFRMTYSLAGLTSGEVGFKLGRGPRWGGVINAEHHGRSGLVTPERISILKPKFGKAKHGIELGVAVSTLQASFPVEEVYRRQSALTHDRWVPPKQLGHMIPMDLFVRNAGSREVSFQLPDISWSPPDVVASDGQSVYVQPIPLFDTGPVWKISLKPGEVYGIRKHGVGVSRHKKSTLSFVPPAAGMFDVSYTYTIQFDGEAGGSEELTTGKLTLEVIDGDNGQGTVQRLAVNPGPPEQPAYWTPAEYGSVASTSTGVISDFDFCRQSAISRETVTARVQALGGEIRRLARNKKRLGGVEIVLWKTKATDKDLESIGWSFNMIGLGLCGTNVTDDGLVHLQNQKYLGDLDLCATAITDKGLVHLEDLTSLEILSLIDTEVTDAGMKHLKPLKNLRMLMLHGTKVTDDGLIHLGDFPKIDTLGLNHTKVDEGLRHLANLKTLRDIRLVGSTISDKGLKHLNAMTNLKTVVLNDTEINGSGLRHLPLSVEKLFLPATNIKDDGLSNLVYLKNLEVLQLSEHITDKGVPHLEKLSSLRELTCSGTKITEAGFKRLESALPNCKVLR